jgi:Ferritin-like domain
MSSPDSLPRRSLALHDFDVDGAVGETFERFQRDTRAGFLRRAGRVGAAAVVALGARPAVAAASGLSSHDRTILNFALALEYLQASFYTEAERIGALRGALDHQAHVVGMHERDHVKAFRTLLGSAAIKEPSFNFHGVTGNPSAFRSTAVAFEDLAAAAYKQQAPLIQSRDVLAGALAIHSVEARHAAWIRRLAGFLPAAKAFDDPLPDNQVIDIVNSTHFVTLQQPSTTAQTAPQFTG